MKKRNGVMTMMVGATLVLVGCLDRADPRRVDATHLARTDADSHAVLAKDDRVGLDELGDFPREQQVGDLRRVWRLVGNHLEVGFGNHAIVG